MSGAGFSATASANTVTINGVRATVPSAAATRLVVTVPASATSGVLQVTTPAGTVPLPGITIVTGDKPAISGFTPATATAGSSVTLSVTNPDPQFANNLVRINGVLAPVTAQGPARSRSPCRRASAAARCSSALGRPAAGGVPDEGMVFMAFQNDLDAGVVRAQQRLRGDALAPYLLAVGGGYFVTPGPAGLAW